MLEGFLYDWAKHSMFWGQGRTMNVDTVLEYAKVNGGQYGFLLGSCAKVVAWCYLTFEAA